MIAWTHISDSLLRARIKPAFIGVGEAKRMNQLDYLTGLRVTAPGPEIVGCKLGDLLLFGEPDTFRDITFRTIPTAGGDLPAVALMHIIY